MLPARLVVRTALFLLALPLVSTVGRTPPAVLGPTVLVAQAVPAGTSGESVEAAHPCAASPYREFDFWIGEWDVVNRWKQRTDPMSAFRPNGTATNQVHAVAGGCGIVEHWQGRVGTSLILGFSVRNWNAIDEEWDLLLLWPQPNRTSFGTLAGTFQHGRGEFFGGTEPNFTRYSFSDITPTSLRWDDAYTTDGGRSWEHSWVMEFSRRSAGADPLFLNAPAVRDFRCDDPAFREYDHLSGGWEGQAEVSGSAARRVTMTSVPILGGCAHMNLVAVDPAGEDETEIFVIRALETGQGDPAGGAWVEWQLHQDDPVLRRISRDGPDSDATWVGRRRTAEGFVDVRTRWESSSGAALVWVEEESDGEGGWTETRRVALTRWY